MSLQVPLIGVTSRYVSRLSNLPSSNDSKKLLDTDNVEGVLNLIQNSCNLIPWGPNAVPTGGAGLA